MDQVATSGTATSGREPFNGTIAHTGAEVGKKEFGALIQADQYVGETWDVDYDYITVQVHDSNRKNAGGIPKGCFLIATRLKPDDSVSDWNGEDSSLILLRVVGSGQMWNAAEVAKIRAEAGQRATQSSHGGPHWETKEIMDAYTAQAFAYAVLKCRVLGTFYLKQIDPANESDVQLVLGSDIDNYYPNRGLKVYKPTRDALKRIVNFRDPELIRDPNISHHAVNLGRVRYTSTDRGNRGLDEVQVSFVPTDLLKMKTALFGMTRMGKSNTTKIIAQSVFNLRFDGRHPVRVGQIIFDYNGEYANENVQDSGALKNVYLGNPAGDITDVVTYGVERHPNDPNRRLMKINFYATALLAIGKDIIGNALADDGSKYVVNFCDAVLEPPIAQFGSAGTRYNRHVLCYRALLCDAGFGVPANLVANTSGLFSQDLIQALQTSQDDPNGDHARAAAILAQQHPSWPHLVEALKGLRDFIKRGNNTGFAAFNTAYMNRANSSGEKWNDQTLDKILGMWDYPNGPRLIGRVAYQHDPGLQQDYSDQIYDDLVAGRLVIVDQSQGDADQNKMVADRTMKRILRGNQTAFSRNQEPAQILVYVEEAHNLLPTGGDLDPKDPWVKTAKEGAKMNIGLVYATQEPSSIQKNILKNTSNWIIGHLNNADELKEIAKFYDFEDFSEQILAGENRGFMRVKTLSNKFTIPVQIDRFQVPVPPAVQPNA